MTLPFNVARQSTSNFLRTNERNKDLKRFLYLSIMDCIDQVAETMVSRESEKCNGKQCPSTQKRAVGGQFMRNMNIRRPQTLSSRIHGLDACYYYSSNARNGHSVIMAILSESPRTTTTLSNSKSCLRSERVRSHPHFQVTATQPTAHF